mgnify:CR=1 FL=1
MNQYAYYTYIVEKTARTLLQASSVLTEDKTRAFQRALEKETNLNARWAMEEMLNNARCAKMNCSAMCDDTGVPHLFLEAGPGCEFDGNFLLAIQDGVAEGLRRMPGRPMAVLGDDIQRIEQSQGLDNRPEAVLPAPILIKRIEEPVLRLHILMQGGGPAIRGMTRRIFHQHSAEVVQDEIVRWACEAIKNLGCSPSTLTIGIGRSLLEATALMTEAQIYGRHGVYTSFEEAITEKVNQCKIGALGLGGSTTVLGTFVRIGPQRASGVRIVCLRPCCYMEPRLASVVLLGEDDHV